MNATWTYFYSNVSHSLIPQSMITQKARQTSGNYKVDFIYENIPAISNYGWDANGMQLDC